MLNKLNPIPEEVREGFVQMKFLTHYIVTSYQKGVEWFHNFKENVANMSVDLLGWVFEFLTKTILHTPTFLFNTEIIKQSTLNFTGLSVVAIVLLSLYEGFKKMFSTKENQNLTDLKRIYSRVPLVVLISSISPYLFYQLFKVLNWLTNFIIQMGKNQIENGFKGIKLDALSFVDVFLYVSFDIALIFFLIPILLSNFKRWYDLILLSCLTPLAMSCYVFKSQEHLFRTWITNIRKKSIHQLVYAIYLVIIATIVFGTKIPENSMDVFVKLGLFIGGLHSLRHPPSFVRNLGDSSKRIDEVWEGASSAMKPNVGTKKVFDYFKNVFRKGK